MRDEPVLTFEVATKAGTKEFPVTGIPCVIGSDEDAGVRLRHPSVLGMHALIRRTGGQLVISKADPEATMQVGGRDIDRAALADGTVVRVGAVPMRVRMSARSADHGADPVRATRMSRPSAAAARDSATPGQASTPANRSGGIASRAAGSVSHVQPQQVQAASGTGAGTRTIVVGWVLIALGVADILQWMLTKPGIGWTNYVLGDNFLTRYGWGMMIGAGVMLVRRGNAERRAAQWNAELDPGESVVLTKRSSLGVLTVTDRRIRFQEADLSTQRKGIRNIPAGSSVELALSDIESIRAVRQREVASTKLAGIINTMWGISITTKDGDEINLPVSDAVDVAALAQRFMS